MYIEKIEIQGFRNLKEKTGFDLVNNKNLIYGSNGSGKTSVLESIYVLGFGKSFLNVKRDEILNENSNEFLIKAILRGENSTYELKAFYQKAFEVYLYNEKQNIYNIGKYLFPVYFSSSNYTHYVESRSYLRKMIDRFIYGIDPVYAKELIEYNRIIKQKSHLLKFGGNISQLTGWNRSLSETMEVILKKRTGFLNKLNTEIADNFRNGLNVKYISDLFDAGETDTDKNLILDKLNKIRDREIFSKRILKGTHLDVFEIYYMSKQLKYFSSGEKKINLLLLYLSYIEIFKKIRGEYPVFLIDDYDTAMDKKNIGLLTEKYPKMQIIATSVKKNSDFINLIKLKNHFL
ncbi:MAG: AAA family ATPase [Acidobacteriota bacterium]